MFKRIDHVEIVARDFEQAIAFYRNVLGFTMKERMPVDAPPLREIAYLSLGDTVLELMRVDTPAPPAAGWSAGYRMMAIEVEDMDAALAHLAEHGVMPTWGPVALGPSRRAEIHDSEGNAVELRQW